MASQRGRARWGAVLAGLLIAPIMVGTAVHGGPGQPVIQAAAAELTQPATSSAAEPTTAASDDTGSGTSTATSTATSSATATATSTATSTTSASASATQTATLPTAGRSVARTKVATRTPAPAPSLRPVGTAPRTIVVTKVRSRTPAPPRTAPGARTPSVTFIGDSWTAGEAATNRRGYAVLTGEQLGWRTTILGIGGSGYTRGGTGIFDNRVAQAVATHADVIVVQGSLNERSSTPGELGAAALSTLRHLRVTADPGTLVLVVGATYSPGTPAATIDWINAAVRQAAATVGLRFVDPAAEHWIDPADPTVWANADHPNDRGYQIVADRMEPLLRSVLGR